jgi:hypothetical protein
MNYKFEPGSQVVLTRADGRKEIRSIGAIFGNRVRLESRGVLMMFDGRGIGCSRCSAEMSIVPADENGLADFKDWVAARAEAKRLEAERKETDPRTPYVRRLSGDWHPWEKLTLEQLKTIASIFDAIP